VENKERGAETSNTSAAAIGALMQASGAAVVRSWFEAIACFRAKLLQTKVGFADLARATPGSRTSYPAKLTLIPGQSTLFSDLGFRRFLKPHDHKFISILTTMIAYIEAFCCQGSASKWQLFSWSENL
jgi:hypothetical protein